MKLTFRARARGTRLVAAAFVVILAVAGVAYRARSRPPSPAARVDTKFIDPDTPCGAVSLATVSHLLGRPVSIAEFRAATKSGDLGVCSVGDLLAALRAKGFAATAVRYDPGHPPSHSQPMVLFVDGDHFLAALPAAGARVLVLDPPNEVAAVAWPTLAPRWRGEAVIVGRDEAEVARALARN